MAHYAFLFSGHPVIGLLSLQFESVSDLPVSSSVPAGKDVIVVVVAKS